MLTKFNGNLNYNQSQPDQPNTSADEMKKLLDQAGIDLKEYINTVLTEELDKIIETKVDKVKGKGLSEKDFTDAYETKLNSIASGANKTVVDTSLNNSSTNPVQNKVVYNELLKKAPKDTVTTSASGLMSASDKVKLDGIASGANKTIVDSSLSSTSTNPVQNKVVNNAVNNVNSKAVNAQSTADDAYEKASNATDAFYSFLQSGGTINGSLNLVGNFKNQETYANTVPDASNVYISSKANFRRSSSSSRRYKKDITEKLEERLDPQKLYDLPVVQFKYKEGYLNKDDRRYNENILGFIAEDIAEIYESAAQYNDDGSVEMWNYKVIVPALLKLIQEIHEDVEELKKKAKEE
nr:MAG TPA: endosialidase chaperone [Caudoviricetes sp.]